MSERAQILIRHAVDLKVFRDEIMPAGEPVILKGLVNDLEGPPSIHGHFFYRDDMRGLNFERRPAVAHLPRELRGMMGPHSAERTQAVRAILARAFSRT